MASFPRYTTYGVGELEETLRGLDRSNGFSQSLPSPTGIPTGTRSPKGLLNRHSCVVTFPDKTSGTCLYTRVGPAWHTFQYERTGSDGQIHRLPAVYENKRIANTVAAIEEIARRLASDAFWSGVLRERKEYFQRASDGMGRKAKPERFQMKAARAKELSGKYALCRKVGKSRIPVNDYYTDLKEAVSAWEERQDKTLVIACCNRLDRCWEEPQFNPLHANPDYPCAARCPKALELPTPPPREWTSAQNEEYGRERNDESEVFPESDEFGDEQDDDSNEEDEEYLDGPHDDEEEA